MSNQTNRKSAIIRALVWNIIPLLLVISVAYVLSATKIAELNEKNFAQEEMIISLNKDIEAHQDTQESHEERIQLLSDSLITAIAEKAELEQELEGLIRERDRNNDRMAYLKDIMRGLHGSEGTLQQELRQKEEDNRQLRADIRTLQDAKGGTTAYIEVLQQKISSLQTDILRKTEREAAQEEALRSTNEKYALALRAQHSIIMTPYGVALKDKNGQLTTKLKNLNKMEIDFTISFTDIGLLNGHFFSAEIFNTATGKALALEEDPMNTGKRTRRYFEYQEGIISLSFTNHEKKNKGGKYALRLYFHPFAKSTEDAKTRINEVLIRGQIPITYATETTQLSSR